MVKNSAIEWTDHTFNPWIGCTKVSAACDNCYAEAWAKRYGRVEWGDHPRERTGFAYWRQPENWNREAHEAAVRRKVFCASLSDVFDNQVDPSWREDLWDLIDVCRELDWLLLTKRPQNIARMQPPDWDDGWANVWLGTSVENQHAADMNVPCLRDAPAKKRFLSCEPLLGPIDLAGMGGIDWVIAGGESGPRARPMAPEWARSLRTQCAAAGVPFFFKQWGEWVPADQCDPSLLKPGVGIPLLEWGGHAMVRLGKKRAGAMLDGREHHASPLSPFVSDLLTKETV